MLVIGLTGGIASGKSTVSRMLRELGAPVVDADALVHELQAPGAPVTLAIGREFGPEVLRPDGALDRAALGKIVFADPERRKALEAIVHPAVRGRMWAEVERYRVEGRPATVLDVPLLIEGGIYRTVDRVWLVYVDRATQKARLMARDGLRPEQADLRIAAQLSLDEKRAYADLVFDNQGTEAATRQQVMRAWEAVAGSQPAGGESNG
ncbi:MAG TPA: dephospho-CoA kinase [Symbiobacteriaceae bacterium]|nr:dephospho-CoA kinase [Symbiobacteriaceae bacterium]